MTYETYRTIFYGGAALAALCLIAAVILFFVLKIYNVIGDLTGSTARRSIEKMRYKNEASGEKTYKSSHVNIERGNLTDRIMQDGSIVKYGSGKNSAMNTTKIATSVLESEAMEAYTTLLEEQRANETTMLSPEGSAETTMLSPDGSADTTMLEQTMGMNAGDNAAYYAGQTTQLDENDYSGQTTKLDEYDYSGQTTKLDEDDGSGQTTQLSEAYGGETTLLDQDNGPAFEIEYELMFINSDERIE